MFRGSSNILKNISWLVNICPKYFTTTTKTFNRKRSNVCSIPAIASSATWKKIIGQYLCGNLFIRVENFLLSNELFF